MIYLKMVVIGDGGVGKTSLLERYTNESFDDSYIPTIFDNYTKIIEHGGKHYTLQLWDTAGQEEYEHVRKTSYSKTDAFIICFSLVNERSFSNVKHLWNPELQHEWPDGKIILVGTKKDLCDFDGENGNKIKLEKISVEKGNKLAEEIKAVEYYETSAKDNSGITDIFQGSIQA
jgi:small GTP-binding protein